MKDYQPLDLTNICNTAADKINLGISYEQGKSTMRGIPFIIGNNAHNNMIVVSSKKIGKIKIPIETQAHRIIVAHRLLEVSKDAPTGIKVADYIFNYDDGSKIKEEIRNHFDISDDTSSKGPFKAVSIDYTSLQPRNQGDFGNAGKRQMEGVPGKELPFILWTWQNKEPDKALTSLEIVPSDAVIAIGGITIGNLDEHPFARQGLRPVGINLKDSTDASTPFDIEVSVDRGEATYPYALPEQSANEFLEDPSKGWGEAQNTTSNPSYVEISAIPSATLSVKQNGKTIASTEWGKLQNELEVDTVKAKFQLLDRGKNWVHVNVIDEGTGKPVPCRVHFRSPEGIPYQPYGHHNHVNSNMDTFHFDIGGDLRLGQISYAYIDGTCQGWLPRGQVLVDISRGFEYEPLRTSVEIKPGQRDLTLKIKRWTDMNSKGWYSGDSHVHFVGTQGAHAEAQGEDLDIVNLLQSQWGSLFTNTEDFTGYPSVSQNSDSIVYVGQENRQHFYGHLILWDLKKPVMPWCTGEFGESEMASTMEATLSDWADQAHAQGATVVAPHFGGLNGETAALVATGRLSAVEMHRQNRNMHWEYYRTLNAGYQLPLLGGTDKMYSDVPVGMYRTYVKMQDGEEFNYKNWCDNVTRGRTFHSGGPIINLTVDGKEIGDTIRISGSGTVEVEAWAESILPIFTLQIVLNGKVVASTDSKEGTGKLKIRESIKIDQHSWIAARCGGPGYYGTEALGSFKSPSWANQFSANKDILGAHYDGWRRGVFAHTSPIYIECGEDWWMFDEKTARHMLTVFEGDMSFMRNITHQHEHGSVTHHHGQDDHLEYLSKPFIEARNAVLKKMEKYGILP